MKPTLLHFIDNFSSGGAELGIRTMLQEGFYDPFDTHIVAIRKGEGSLYPSFVDHLGANKVRCLVDREKFWMLGNAPKVLSLLSKEIQRTKPSVVILTSRKANAVGRLVALRFPRIKIIPFEHMSNKPNWKIQLVYKLTAWRCSAVFGDSPSTLECVEQNYPKSTPRIVVPMKIVRAMPMQDGTIQTPKKFKILTLGRLAIEKNFENLIAAMAQMVAQGRDCELTILGRGNLREELEQHVSNCGLEKRVTFGGFIADKAELARIRDAHDIYVQPSLHEGCCLATVEAMAAGMVVAATAFAGTRHYGKDGHNIKIIHDMDPTSIARELGWVMDHYARIAPQYSRNAQQTIMQHFGAEPVHAMWRMAQNTMLNLAEQASRRSLPWFGASSMNSQPMIR
jgi:glycosyltransferase involved in cell wall biosynthesis